MALFPAAVKNTEEALNYLAAAIQAAPARVIALVSSAAATLNATAAQVLSGFFDLNGGSTCTFNLPTAAAVIAAMSNPAVGSTFQFEIVNRNSGTATLTTSAGNTIVGTATIATTKGQTVRGIVTNATPGAEAISYYPVGSAGY